MASPNKLSPIPRPPGKPVVGNMLSLDSTAPVQNLARLAKWPAPQEDDVGIYFTQIFSCAIRSACC